MTKLNFKELENVSGGAATQTYEYQIIELATNAVVGSYTDKEEADEALGNYGDGYIMKTIVI